MISATGLISNLLSHEHNKQTRISKEWYTDFRDTLAVLTTVEDGPGNTARVLALKEEGLGLSILEAEDLAVATDVQLTLCISINVSTYFIDSRTPCIREYFHSRKRIERCV